MKILFVAGRHLYGDPRRGDGYEFANMLPALRAMGHSVAHFESFDRHAHTDFAALNAAFLESVERERPDIVFCVLTGYEIWTESLDLVRATRSATLVTWGADDSWKYDQFSRYIMPHVDCYATTSAAAYARAQVDGFNQCVLSQWAAADELLVPPRPASECRYKVSFVGAAYGNRRSWVRALEHRGIHVDCFGHGWPNGPIPGDEMRTVVRDSIVTLNFGDSGLHWRGVMPYRSRQIKARVFEVPGAGGFLLTESADGLNRHYQIGEEVVTFESQVELIDRVQYFLSHPDERDRIARAGHARTRAEHTYAHRLALLLDEALALRAHRPPVDGPIATITELAAQHRLTPALQALRWLVTMPFRAIWGKERGARAARRLLHELSWRIVGATTYQAIGWPGRLFYRES
ncbi:MAG: glycosyltransferase [Burkholderiales bacterium]